MKITLPSWANRGEVAKLGVMLERWWAYVTSWLEWPIEEMDPDTCGLSALNLLAWQRNVTRFDREPIELYRLRVKYAYVNTVDAGSVAGIQRIFDRLGVGYVEVIERDPNRDWDVIILQLSDAQLSHNQDLLRLLLQKYGRTCRRYEFKLISPVGLGISVHEIDHAWYFDAAS
ncbi:phage tail protein [Microbulbifer variabilis]|uniref:Phage tail protein n=1 Tax=Microbulbifer variabilis TaxID=266805 RepID=A0ABY4V8N1_9GAMM|nr:phage tail protein [Microbulbifer variabilis]USD19761.1 phage tail protein [Microbulbifer variabilis]